MKKLFLAAAALFVISVVAAPSAGAQEVEKEAKAEKTEMAKKAKAKWMKGTMTPPGQAAMDVSYKFTKGEDGM